MKHSIYGIAAVLAMSVAMPAMAQTAPAMQQQGMQQTPPPAMATMNTAPTTTQVITRTIVVRETPLFGQQIVTALDGKSEASDFRNLLAANGLAQTLRDNDEGYTAFVPVNKAFEKNNMQVPAAPAANGTINAEARSVLEDHVVDSKFDVNLLHGNRDNVKSLSGKTITISKMGKNYYANGHLIVDRWHDPEGIIYFTEDFVTAPGFSTAVYNPADVKK